MSRTLLLLTFVLSLIGFTSRNHVEAVEFHVTTDIFVGADAKPVETHLTTFHANVVYDSVTSGPGQITIIDFNQQLIYLLDTTDKTQFILKQQDVLGISTSLSIKLRAQLARPDNKITEYIKAHFTPDFDVKDQKKNSTVIFAGTPLSYEVSFEKSLQNNAVQDYYRFCDWSANLNYATVLGGTPPQARFEVNQKLKEAQVFPKEIQRTIKNANPGRIEVVKSKHEFRWESTPQDEQRLTKFIQYQTNFRRIDRNEFFAKQRANNK
ncbi:MAG: hypothetical protein COA78_07365 [Blastopirellula sp.]|nr:MAG: hypothetical protein COA78_07365 [Blastopirellula sp.]